jgi:hypothetical protein
MTGHDETERSVTFPEFAGHVRRNTHIGYRVTLMNYLGTRK